MKKTHQISIMILSLIFLGCDTVKLSTTDFPIQSEDIPVEPAPPVVVDMFPDLPEIPLHFVSLASTLDRQALVDFLQDLNLDLSGDEQREILTAPEPDFQAGLKFLVQQPVVAELNRQYSLPTFAYQIVFSIKARKFSLDFMNSPLSESMIGGTQGIFMYENPNENPRINRWLQISGSSLLKNGKGLNIIILGLFRNGLFESIQANLNLTEPRASLIGFRALVMSTRELPGFNTPISTPSICFFTKNAATQVCH